MNFTQFVYPNGHKKSEFIQRSPEIEALAIELQDHGWRFEIEVNPDTQLVLMDCCGFERPLAARTCPNGPQVPAEVDELAKEAHAAWVAEGRPLAK